MADNASQSVNLGAAHVSFTADYSHLVASIKHAVKMAEDGAKQIQRQLSGIQITAKSAVAGIGDGARQSQRTVSTAVRAMVRDLGQLTRSAVQAGITISTSVVGAVRAASKAWADYHRTFGEMMARTRMRLVFFKLDMEFMAAAMRRFALGASGALGSMSAASITFESAFVAVRRTVDASEAEFAQLAENIRMLSKQIPISANALAELMGMAGRMGIRGVTELTRFTETIAKLSIATDIVGEQSAEKLAQLLNIMGEAPANIDRVGSAITDLGNKFATNEQAIVDMSMRLAGAAQVIGMSTADVLGLAAALSQAGVRAEMGGSALSRVMISMAQSVANNTRDLRTFARVAGMSAQQFANMFRTAPLQAIEAFIVGLRRMDEAGQNVFDVLEEVGMTEIRTRDALLRLLGAADKLSYAIETSNRAWRENIALNREVQTALNTTGAQTTLLWNELVDLARSIGNELQPVLRYLISIGRDVVTIFEGLTDEQRQNIAQWTVLAAVIGTVSVALMTVAHIVMTVALTFVLLAQAISALASPWFIGFMSILLVIGLVKRAFEEDWLGIASGFTAFAETVGRAFDALDLGSVVEEVRSSFNEIREIWASDLTLEEKIVETGGVIVELGKFMWGWAGERFADLFELVKKRWDLENLADKTLPEKVIGAARIVVREVAGLVESIVSWWLDVSLSLATKTVEILGLEPDESAVVNLLRELQAIWDREDLTFAEKTVATIKISFREIIGLLDDIKNWWLYEVLELDPKTVEKMKLLPPIRIIDDLIEQIQEIWAETELNLVEKIVETVKVTVPVVWTISAAIGFIEALTKLMGLTPTGGIPGRGARYALRLATIGVSAQIAWELVPEEVQLAVQQFFNQIADAIRQFGRDEEGNANPITEAIADRLTDLPLDGWELPALTAVITFAGFKLAQSGAVIAAMLGRALAGALVNHSVRIASLLVTIPVFGASAATFWSFNRFLGRLAISLARNPLVIAALGIVIGAFVLSPDSYDRVKEIVNDVVEEIKTTWETTVSEGRVFDIPAIIVRGLTEIIYVMRDALKPVKEFLAEWSRSAWEDASFIEAFRRTVLGEDIDPQVRGFLASLFDFGSAIGDFLIAGFELSFDLFEIIYFLMSGTIAELTAPLRQWGGEIAGNLWLGFQEMWEKFGEWFASWWDGLTEWWQNTAFYRFLVSVGLIRPEAPAPATQMSEEERRERMAEAIRDIDTRFRHFETPIAPSMAATSIAAQMVASEVAKTFTHLRDVTAELEYVAIEYITEAFKSGLEPTHGEVLMFLYGVAAQFGETADEFAYAVDQILEMIRQMHSPYIVPVTQEEKELLARLVEAEAGIEPFEGKVAVAEVVLNRLLHPSYPDTIEGVIYQPGQFEPVLTGFIDQVKATEDAFRAVEEALLGSAFAMGALHFANLDVVRQRNPQSWFLSDDFVPLVKIGRHTFGHERRHMQHGGILPGLAGPDQFLALLAPGEAVVPSQVVRQGWPGVLAWFRKMGVPGFKNGKPPTGIPDLVGQPAVTWDMAIELRQTVESLSGSLLTGIENAAKWLGELLFGGFELLIQVLQTLFPEQKEAFENIVGRIQDIWTQLWDRRMPVVPQWEERSEAITPIGPRPEIDPRATPWERLVQRIRKGFDRMIDWIQRRWDESVNLVSEHLEKGARFISNARDWFGKPLEEQVDDLKNAFATGALFIMDAFGELRWIVADVAKGVAIFGQTLVNEVPGATRALSTYRSVSEDHSSVTAATVAIFEALVANSELLSRSISALALPISIVVRAFGDALAPALKAIFPIIKSFGQITLTVIQGIAWVWNSIVGTIGGIFRSLSQLNIFGWRPLAFLESVANFFEDLMFDTKALSDAQKELAELTWEQALASKEAARQLRNLNIPSGFRIALERYHAQTPVVPMADGGIVKRPTIALVGEAGPEAVIPLERGGVESGGMTIIIQGDVYGYDDFQRKVVEAYSRHQINQRLNWHGA